MRNIFSKKAKAEHRVLTHPERRLPIRADFPRIVELQKDRWHLNEFSEETVRAELQKLQGYSEAPVRVTIIYPHKRPSRLKGKPHRLAGQAQKFRDSMALQMPDIQWHLADGLCERYKHKRVKVKNQMLDQALKRRQSYVYNQSLQVDPFPFMDPSHSGKELFVLFDDVYSQGTTAVNIINFIEHNGGHVLAAFAGQHVYRFGFGQEFQYIQQPDKPFSTQTAFVNQLYNTGQIPYLAKIFHKAAQKSQRAKEFTPEQCLEDVDRMLHGWGYSLPTLTNGECFSVQRYLYGALTFHNAIKGVGYDGFIKAFSGGPYREKPSPR
ncbi:MAG: hypothetical protein H6867_02980 [Rhodospirillales bacterium]|nr:hypothetical protein [Rhodospirillales bacterium]MCB9996115.1 hypothetical protein [Rhodospirillales bacterium]